MAAADQSSPGPAPEPALLGLAREKFGALSAAEEELFRAAQEGRSASALTGEKKDDDPADAANWKAERVVRAECISWVCTDPRASALVAYRGLALSGMRIDAELDLSNAEIRFPLLAWRCAFTENISLQVAQLRGFYLLGCEIKSLDAAGATFDGSVGMCDAFKAEGEVNLMGTKIRGNLDCRVAWFLNAGGLALTADGAKIEGHVLLRDGFKAEGGVNLRWTTIGRGLDCNRGWFLNAEGLALTAEGAKVEGGVFLRNGFKAEGEVNLAAATIENLQIVKVVAAKETVFNLRLAKVGTFWDDEGSWPEVGNLFLDGFRYDRLDEEAPFQASKRKKWLRLQRRGKFRPQPYEQLAAVLRQMGHEPDARRIMIEKNHDRARHTRLFSAGWWWYNSFGKFIGYGYRPGLAFLYSLLMILLGTLFFHFGSTHGLMSPTSENAYVKASNGQAIDENGRKKMSEEYPAFHAFIYSFESFVPLLKLDQSTHWRPNANRGAEVPFFRLWTPRSGELLRDYLCFHIAAGWLLTSLWVGAITGLVKT